MPFVPDATLDLILDNIATATMLCLCSQDPTTYAEANATYMLAQHVLTGGDFTKADDTSGRKVTLAEQASFTVTSTGTATHLALVRTADSTLLYTTALASSQGLTAAGTVTVPEVKIANVQDPTV